MKKSLFATAMAIVVSASSAFANGGAWQEGIPATGRNVRVPLAVSYEVEGGLIKRARIYMLVNVLLGQIGPATGK